MTEDKRPTADHGQMADDITTEDRRRNGESGPRSSVSGQTYKFQRLEIYQLALTYIDLTYDLAARLPRSEDFGLKSQITRAANSIALNIAEGSTGQTDAEQSRFLGMALRSLIETIACHDIIQRRRYVSDVEFLESRQVSTKLFAKMQTMRRSLGANDRRLTASPRSSVLRHTS